MRKPSYSIIIFELSQINVNKTTEGNLHDKRIIYALKKVRTSIFTSRINSIFWIITQFNERTKFIYQLRNFIGIFHWWVMFFYYWTKQIGFIIFLNNFCMRKCCWRICQKYWSLYGSCYYHKFKRKRW